MLSFILLVIGVLAQQTFAEEPEAIIGGLPAVPGEFPYQVSLRKDGSHICGGSIIRPTKILTAAHCVYGIVYPYTNLKIATGTNDILTGQLHEVKNIRAHSGFFTPAPIGADNDVAVITLSKPIQYNQYQASIDLTETKPVDGQQCTHAGWGIYSTEGMVFPLILQKVNQVVISLKKCRQRYNYNVRLTEGQMCSYSRYGIGACKGDSGDPIVSNGKQIGIHSWVTPCAKGKPDVHMDVYHYRNFILSSLEEV